MHEAGGSNGETNTKNRFTAVRWTGFCRVLTEKMQEQSLVSQGFAGF